MLPFGLLVEEDGSFYLHVAKTGAGQVRDYCAADLHFFSHVQ